MALGLMEKRWSVELEDRQLKRRLRRLARKTGDLKPAFRMFDRDVGKFFRKRFETAGEHGGKPWKPLAERTKERRQKPLSEGGTPNIGGVDHPLWDSAELKTSLQEVGGNSIRVLGKMSYERGTRVPYAIYHQQGRGVPQRQIIPTTTGGGPPKVLREKLMERLTEHMDL